MFYPWKDSIILHFKIMFVTNKVESFRFVVNNWILRSPFILPEGLL